MTNNDFAMTDQERNYLEHHDPFILGGIKDTSDYADPDRWEDEDERRINEALRNQ